MRFSRGELQAVGLINADPPRIGNGGFIAANVKLTGQALSPMMSKIGNAAIDFASGAKIVKELWSQLYAQYYKKR